MKPSVNEEIVNIHEIICKWRTCEQKWNHLQIH